MNPESHALLVIAAYALTFVVIAVMLARILLDHRGLRMALARIEKTRQTGDAL